MKCIVYRVLFVFSLYICMLTGTCGFTPPPGEHRTKEASQKLSDLYCYRCDSMIDGERCQDLRDNSTSMHNKCSNEQRTCKVKRISMSASTEDVTGKPKLWLLQRNCTKFCEPGCIVIGERTKLHSCTTCCENSFCNTGSGTQSYFKAKDLNLNLNEVILPVLVILYGAFGDLNNNVYVL